MFGNFITLKANCWELVSKHGIRACENPEAFHTKFSFDPELAALSERYGATYVSLRDLFCSGGACLLELDGVPFTWDKVHLSLEFSMELGRRMAPLLR